MPGQNVPAAPDSLAPDVELNAQLKEAHERVEAAYRARIERELRDQIVIDIEATRAEWNDEVAEGPSGCAWGRKHDCHHVGAELAFEAALRSVRGGQ